MSTTKSHNMKTKTIIFYINTLKSRYNLSSYYAAMTFLELPRQSWTKIKNGGGISDKNAIKLAAALKIDPLEIIAISNSLSAKNQEICNIWQKLAKDKEKQRLTRKKQ